MIYFDSAATSYKPDFVHDAVYNYSKKYNVNIHRGVCRLSTQATDLYELSRKYVAKFINAKSEREIIFTYGTTHSLNLLANSICKSFDIPDRNIIVTTELEHTSNIVVWQKYCVETKKKRLFFIPMLPNGLLDLDMFEKFLKANGNKVYLLTITHISNALGTVNDIKKIIDLCHSYKVMVCIDAAQSIAHTNIDVQELNCDFLAFSGHKVFAPFGTGILYVKESYLQHMKPFMYGGGGVSQVRLDDTEFADYPYNFEVGTQNLSGIAGLHAALYWFNEKVTKEKAFQQEDLLYKYAVSKIQALPQYKIIGSPEHSKGIISIVHDKLTANQVAKILSDNDVCIRSGYHCTHTVMQKLNLKDGTARISLSFVNTTQEIDYLTEVLKNI